MTTTRIARRQLAVDRLAEELGTWGSPHAVERAQRLLAVVEELGYALPAALDDPPPRSTQAGDHRPHIAHIRAVLADPNHPDRAPRLDRTTLASDVP